MSRWSGVPLDDLQTATDGCGVAVFGLSIEAMARAAGWRVGAYTSPHLLRYNERVRVDSREADDVALVAAFAAVEAARGDVALTYFEFTTLAILRLLSQGKPNKSIARDLNISEGTVKIHLAAIFRALNVRNRVEAVVASQQLADL